MGKTASLANIGSIADSSLGFRNRIINGGMVLDQRNAGAAVTAGSGYTLDRWNVDRTWAGSTVTIQQSTTAPSGFTNSLLATVTTGAAVAAGSYFSVQQYIEGYNIADMAWGTASALQFTVSFWVRSSITGTFGVCFRNSAFNLSYCTTYTVSAANTWEQKSVTITAPTTGTWGTGNSYGINVIFSLGGGSSSKPAANNTWTAGSYIVAIGETDLIASTGATFYITGVQLEKGSTATSFDYRSYGTELALCQRYYAKLSATYSNFAAFGSGTVVSSTLADVYIKYPVQMRASATLTQSNTKVNAGITGPAVTSISSTYPGTDSSYVSLNTNTGLTVGQGAVFLANNNANAYIDFSAEL